MDVFGDTLAKCGHCALVFVDPPPTMDEMVRRHQSEQYAQHPYFAAGEDVAREGALPIHDLVLQRLRALLPKRSRILDVGAGTGDFLKLARIDFDVAAVEPSAYLAQRIREQIGCPVFVGAFEDYATSEPFDAVVLMDIIEHAANPRHLLATTCRVLRPGGVLIVTTVDSECLLYRLTPLIKRLAGRIRVAHYVLHRIFCYQHNWYFNQSVLRGVVSESGFTVAEQRGYEYPLNRLRESVVVKLGLRALYALQGMLGPRTEQYLIARR